MVVAVTCLMSTQRRNACINYFGCERGLAMYDTGSIVSTAEDVLGKGGNDRPSRLQPAWR